MSNFYLDHLKGIKSTAKTADPKLLEPVTRAAVAAIILDAKAQGHDLRLLETYRSQARQAQLFKQGATQLKNVGVHGYGLAADFGLFVNGAYETRGDYYGFLVGLARKHEMISGIDWGLPNQRHSFVDSGHIQRITVARQNSLFAGIWYPDGGYSPLKDL